MGKDLSKLKIPKPELNLKLDKKKEDKEEGHSFFSFLNRKEKEDDMKNESKFSKSKIKIVAFPKIKLNKREKHLLEDKEVSLHEKERRLTRKEKEIHRFEKELRTEEKEWLTEQRKRNEELKQLDEQIEDEIKLKHVEWKKEHALMTEDLKKLRREIAENKNLLKDTVTKLNHNNAFLIRHKEDLKKIEQRKQDITESLIRRENKIKLAETVLSKKDADLLQKEGILNKKDAALKEGFIYMDRKRKEFDIFFTETKKKVDELEKKKVINQKILDENKRFLTGIKATISRETEEFKKNKKLLEKEETSILAKVKLLEKSTLKFHGAEARLIERTRIVNGKIYDFHQEQKEVNNEINRKEKNINEDKKWLDKQYQLLDDKKAKIRAVKEFRVGISGLEKKYKGIQKQITKKEQELDKITRESVAKWELLTDKETELKKREKVLAEGKKLLNKLQNKLIDERAALSDKELKQYLTTEDHFEDVKEEMKEIKTLKGRPEIFDMIEKARFLFNNNKVNEARGLLNKIKTRYEKEKLSQRDKKKVYYDMMEIATEVKLASLK